MQSVAASEFNMLFSHFSIVSVLIWRWYGVIFNLKTSSFYPSRDYSLRDIDTSCATPSKSSLLERSCSKLRIRIELW